MRRPELPCAAHGTFCMGGGWWTSRSYDPFEGLARLFDRPVHAEIKTPAAAYRLGTTASATIANPSVVHPLVCGRQLLILLYVVLTAHCF